MSHALSRLLVVGALVLGVGACGPSPAMQAATPSGTLVVVIRQGPDLVPFHPKVARIQRANAQLAALLGHSIRIELDGAILPQTHEGAEDVIAGIVETTVREVDGVAKEKGALPFAKENFHRLVVRYAPAEAAERERPWRRSTGARLDLEHKTIDVAVTDARWTSLRPGAIAQPLFSSFAAGSRARYANVLPDALPPSEYRAWFDYHADSVLKHEGPPEQLAPLVKVGSFDTRPIRGMLMLRRLAPDDRELMKLVEKQLVSAVTSLNEVYVHHAGAIEGAPASSPFRQAELEYCAWLREEMPRLPLDEQVIFARNLFTIDFRIDMSAKDRFSPNVFPGFDRMAYYFGVVDSWIAAGHPPIGNFPRRPQPRESAHVHPLYGTMIAPAVMQSEQGRLRESVFGAGDRTFYRWAFADPAREDLFVEGLKARSNTALAGTAFVNAGHVLREESEYLRFLRRFEGMPVYWILGADAYREKFYHPSPLLLEEARRLWRDVAHARPHAFFAFASHLRSTPRAEVEWRDFLQGRMADAATLDAYLDLGWEAFELLPVAWSGTTRGLPRIRTVLAHAKPLLGIDIAKRPGGAGVPGVLAEVGRVLCEEQALAEVAELRAFAQAELAKQPGAGLSDVVAATESGTCKPSKPRLAPGLRARGATSKRSGQQ